MYSEADYIVHNQEDEYDHLRKVAYSRGGRT